MKLSPAALTKKRLRAVCDALVGVCAGLDGAAFLMPESKRPAHTATLKTIGIELVTAEQLIKAKHRRVRGASPVGRTYEGTAIITELYVLHVQTAPITPRPRRSKQLTLEHVAAPPPQKTAARRLSQSGGPPTRERTPAP